MTIHKITLPTAYMLETLRSSGVANEEILTNIEKKDIQSWESINDRFDFNKLVDFAHQDLEAFKSIVSEGYEVKFITIKGLQNLLRLKFDFTQDQDYEVTETGISNLQLDESQLLIIKQMLSKNCKIFIEDFDQNLKKVKIDLA